MTEILMSIGFLTIIISNGPGNPRDWVGIFPYNAANDKYISWTYLACNRQNCPAEKATSGTISLPIPKTAGNYDIRFMSATGTNTYQVLKHIDPALLLTMKNENIYQP